MRYQVEIEGRRADVDVERVGGGWRLRIDEGDWWTVPGRWTSPGELLLAFGGRNQAVGVHVDGDFVSVQADGHPFAAKVVDPRRSRAALGGGGAEGAVSTPMPGVVVRIPVEPGQAVSAGQVLVVVEAMKMENEFKSPIDGIVVQVAVEVGQALEANSLLVNVVPE